MGSGDPVQRWALVDGTWHLALSTFPDRARLACQYGGEPQKATQFAMFPDLIESVVPIDVCALCKVETDG